MTMTPEELQNKMHSQVPKLKGFSVVNKGNHYIISKNQKSMRVPLFASREVFTALNTFCK